MRRLIETTIDPLRERLARALIATDFRLVASASRSVDLAQVPVSQDQPILLIIDASDAQDHLISQIKLFRRHYPRGRVTVLADRYHRGDVISAYRAGANSCLTKEMSCGAFLKTLELVMLGETILPPELLPFIRDGHERHEPARCAVNAVDVPPQQAAAEVLPSREIEDDPPPPESGTDALRPLQMDAVPRLSTREKCILRCVAEGCSNKSIARRIDISEATVKVHVKAILRKIRVNNRTQAAIWAVNNSALVWSANADAAPPGDDGHAGTDRRETYRFNSVSCADGLKQNGARLETSHPVRKQTS